MKNEYSKGSQGKYQAATNKSDNYRNPNAPTQGGFSTPGGGLSQKDKASQTQKNPNQQSTNRNPNNTWGTGSINKTDKDSHR